MQKFKNCFANTTEGYEYDIIVDDVKVARAKRLTARDRAEIYEKSLMRGDDGKLTNQLNPMKYQFYTALYSLISWEFEEPLNEENLNRLSSTPDGGKLYLEIVVKITESEDEIGKRMLDNEKN